MDNTLAKQASALGRAYDAYRRAKFPPYSHATLGAHYKSVRQFRENLWFYVQKHGELPTGKFTVYRHPELAPFCAEEFEVNLHPLYSSLEG